MFKLRRGGGPGGPTVVLERILLKSNINIVIDRRPEATSSGPQQAIMILPASTGLTASEKEALRHAISDTLLEDEGWERDNGGRILSAKTKRVIFKVGFLSAIRKMLGE